MSERYNYPEIINLHVDNLRDSALICIKCLNRIARDKDRETQKRRDDMFYHQVELSLITEELLKRASLKGFVILKGRTVNSYQKTMAEAIIEIYNHAISRSNDSNQRNLGGELPSSAVPYGDLLC